MNRLLGFLALACALLLAPEARAEGPRLLDSTMHLELGDLGAPLRIGLARPSVDDAHGFTGCLFSFVVPGLGQLILGRPVLAAAIFGLEALLLVVGIAAGPEVGTLALVLAGVFHLGQAFQAFVLGKERGVSGGGDGGDAGRVFAGNPSPFNARRSHRR